MPKDRLSLVSQRVKDQNIGGSIEQEPEKANAASAFIVFPKGDLVQEGFLYIPNEYENDGIKAVLILAGVTSDLASIPFFIATDSNL
jgi:hypothetical protein